MDSVWVGNIFPRASPLKETLDMTDYKKNLFHHSSGKTEIPIAKKKT